MGKSLKLHFVCEQTFDALPGSDPIERRCPECDRNVINVDPIPDDVREKLVAIATEAGIALCAAGTGTRDAIAPCRSPATPSAIPPFPVAPLAGGAVPPEVAEKIARERAERERREAEAAREHARMLERAKEKIAKILDDERARLRGELNDGLLERLKKLF